MNLIIEKRPFRRAVFALAGLCVLGCLPASAASVLAFYTGDPTDLASGVTNIINPTGVAGFNNGNPYSANLYQSFEVAAGDVTITGVFSNDAIDFTDTQAEWEIRSGMGAGNGGTLRASGTNNAMVIPTGSFDVPDGLPIDTILVQNLSVTLGPGTYWLTVAPVGDGDSGIIGTSGANSVGSSGNIFNFPAIGDSFLVDVQSEDVNTFSMGFYTASASSTPEPGSLLLTGMAMFFAIGLLTFRQRRETR